MRSRTAFLLQIKLDSDLDSDPHYNVYRSETLLCVSIFTGTFSVTGAGLLHVCEGVRPDHDHSDGVRAAGLRPHRVLHLGGNRD